MMMSGIANRYKFSLEEMAQVHGGAELSAQVKEKLYKEIRNAIQDGCTKEMFLTKWARIDKRVLTFAEQVWEVVEFTTFDAIKKRSSQQQ